MVGLAMAMALLASVALNLGQVLEKRALLRLPPVDARRAFRLLRIVLSSPAWIAGFCLIMCGLSLQVVALTMAPVTLVQPVLGTGMVLLLVLSRLILRERLSWVERACVLTLAAAFALVALSAVGSAGPVGYQVSGPWFAVVSAMACAAALVLAAPGLRSGRSRAGAVRYGASAGLLYGVATLALKGAAGLLPRPQPLPPAQRAVIAVLRTVGASPFPYLALACTAAGMLIFQTGLQRCPVSVISPVSVITGSVFFVVAGTVLFGERLPADPVKLALRLAGIGAAVAVMVILARRQADSQQIGHQDVTVMCPEW